MSEITNPFESPDQAYRYHQYRPRFHKIPMQALSDFFGRRLESSLDVACGTGHATEALSLIADEIIGCDSSEEMLKIARSNYQYDFIKANAEKLPFADNIFSLVNISLGFHWVNQKKFLREAKRVLVSQGFLSINNCGFLGTMENKPEFKIFNDDYYQSQFPHPSRNPEKARASDMTDAGFMEIKHFEFKYWVKMNINDFVEFLLTQSNLLVSDRIHTPNIHEELHSSYKPFFQNQFERLHFGGYLHLYKSI